MFFLLDIKDLFTYGKIIANCEEPAIAKVADTNGASLRRVRPGKRLHARFRLMPHLFSRTCREW
ncbi:MAG: hypothetical protein A3E37_05320 [Candidatus Andersenbacteria bacterium RIFCSPHIGHO2_12_FULL_46_9]|nr:MAG: hypothetical protein A3B76_05305 [Candidatus Andersenbacteria bacterium RIFCSPHIGHO2_02_FULL_46_16]OGY36837.1 MAG: hypothetical protein A3I08_03135 [Candidatus Andersenbacteria bacterium RIFCSPLOWO2_02_FULL_46_11]OGY38467.1 MAG: hypothetical protein A3E37_05320 [Candidatus Andersenbacteria bacterium RIFCSPHIGHO2_12_FULL_46_9]OGY41636.1 MAG: hypothetical protein A3G57_02040 [Candidatus Andersenbacteria bacterium RIFCSPLOWO2_12_FULL_45_8]